MVGCLLSPSQAILGRWTFLVVWWQAGSDLGQWKAGRSDVGHFRAEAAQTLLLLCCFSSPCRGASLPGMAAAPPPLVLQ